MCSIEGEYVFVFCFAVVLGSIGQMRGVNLIDQHLMGIDWFVETEKNNMLGAIFLLFCLNIAESSFKELGNILYAFLNVCLK